MIYMPSSVPARIGRAISGNGTTSSVISFSSDCMFVAARGKKNN